MSYNVTIVKKKRFCEKGGIKVSRSIEPLLELFVYETTQLLGQIEKNILDCEQNKTFDCETMSNIWGNLHTIRGSAAMMLYASISIVAHSLEDLFYYMRDQKEVIYNYSQISDIVYRISDFIKGELDKIEDDIEPFGNPECFMKEVNGLLNEIK